MSEQPPPSTPEIAIGDRIDAFEIVEQIGATSTSVVWRAHDGLMDRMVALKQLRPDATGDETVRRRWSHEVSVMKQVTDGDAHLVHLIDWIDGPRGCFIVMEYVDGPSLAAMLAQRGTPLESRQAVGILGATALALATLHRQGIVHRDLKPSNILLPRNGGLKVCDFGLAARERDQEAMSVGTVRYMAPELFVGGEADARSDLYALGMIGYEMLAGREGFDQAFRSVLRDPRSEALRWMKWHTNPRQRSPAITSINPNVQPRLEELIQRLMEKDPHRRVGTAEACTEAIRRHFAPGQAPPQPPQPVKAVASAKADQDTAPLPRRRRLPYVLAAIVVVQILAAAGISAWFHYRDHVRISADHHAAQTSLHEAVQLVTANQYEKAQPALEQLAADPQATEKTRGMAKAWSRFCEAMIAWHDKDYARAVTILDDLEHGGLLGDRDMLLKARDRIDRDRGFATVVDQIKTMIDERRFVEAVAQIDRDTAMQLSREERQRLQTLRDDIQQRRTRQQLDDIAQEVEFNLARGDHEAALNLITRIRERGGPPMPELADLEQHVLDDRTFTGTRRDAEARWRAAAGTGDTAALEEAIALLGKATKMRSQAGTDADHRQLQQQAATWSAELAYRRGLAAETAAAGREGFATANDYFKQAQSAAHPQAAAAVHRVAVRIRQLEAVTAGRQAMQQRRYDEAIQFFQDAAEMRDDAKVQNMLTKATVSMHLEVARTAEKRDDVDAAKNAFQQALAIDSTNAAAEAGMARVTVRAEYLAEVQAGDALFAAGRFAKAKRRYLRAKAIIATPAINQRLDATEFEDLVAKAEHAMVNDAYGKAHALLRAAADTDAGQLAPDRIKALAEKLNQLAPPEDETPEKADD